MDKYERSYKKSCNVKKIKYNGKVYTIDKKALTKFVAQSLLAITLAGVAIVSVAGKAADNIENFKSMNQIKSQYVQVLNDNTHRTNNIEDYWYDYDGIAKGLLKNTEDFDLQLYCIYEQIGYTEESKTDCMDNLFKAMNFEISKDIEKYKDFGVYNDFKNYLQSNGYLSIDEYEEAMDEILNEKINQKEGSSSWKK